MALTTGVDVAPGPGRVSVLGSFAVVAGRFGDARACRAGGRRPAGAFPASPGSATQSPQDRTAVRRSQPAGRAAPISRGLAPAPSRPAVRTRGLIEHLDAGGPIVPFAPARRGTRPA